MLRAIAMAAVAAMAGFACSDPTGLELAVDYPSSVVKLEVSSALFETHTFPLERDGGALIRLQGTIVILLPDDFTQPTMMLAVVAIGEGNGVRLEQALEVTPKVSELVRVDVRLEGCGDGETSAAELCDDINAVPGDGCDQACLPEPGWVCTESPSICNQTCGNGSIDANELCDDGDIDQDDGCSPNCAIEKGFTCDFVPSQCNATCRDGIKAAVEQCDDGNETNGDGCSFDCGVEPGYTCDDFGCRPLCGDGKLRGQEQCDDANADPGDGCSATCTIENGYACNRAEPSMCSADCSDGFVRGVEECDDGDFEDLDGCSSVCRVEIGWECANEPSVCVPKCGDGLVLEGEGCDDGGLMGGDGCSAQCMSEPGYTCLGEPSVCQRCDNGRIEGTEECDDRNAVDGDGCSAACRFEDGYACTGEPSLCATVCGDGLVRGDEQCDDGNTNDGDGCTAGCAYEPGCICLGEPSVCQCCGNGVLEGAEGCDDGNTMASDGCNATCAVENGYGCMNYDPSICYLDATTTFVDGSSTNCPGMGTRAAPFCLFQDGINGPNEDVVVFAAVYDEPVVINGPIRRILADEDAVLENSGVPLTINNASRATIYHLRVTTTAANAVFVTGAGTMADLIETTISGADRGLGVEGGASATAMDATLSGAMRGVNVKDAGSTLSVVSSTISSMSGVGARVETGSLTISESTITSMLQGVLVTGGTGMVDESRIESGEAAGMTMGAGRALAVRNTSMVSSGGWGVYLDDGDVTLESVLVRGSLGGIFTTKAGAALVVLTSSIGPTRGYGLDADDGDITIDRSYVVSNASGGLYLDTNKIVRITNSIIAHNGSPTSGTGGVRYRTEPAMNLFANNTIVRNRSSAMPGVECSSIAVDIVNTIVWDNGIGIGSGISGNCVPSYSNLPVLIPAMNNISADPLFVDPANGDFHLTAGSPCVDAGDANVTTNGITVDLDGDTRPSRNGVDIGADEVP